MSKFPFIAHLCKEGKLDELTLEVSGIATMMGRDAQDVAEEFMEAYKTAEENKDDPAYKQIAKNQKEAIEFYQREHDLEEEQK